MADWWMEMPIRGGPTATPKAPERAVATIAPAQGEVAPQPNPWWMEMPIRETKAATAKPVVPPPSPPEPRQSSAPFIPELPPLEANRAITPVKSKRNFRGKTYLEPTHLQGEQVNQWMAAQNFRPGDTVLRQDRSVVQMQPDKNWKQIIGPLDMAAVERLHADGGVTSEDERFLYDAARNRSTPQKQLEYERRGTEKKSLAAKAKKFMTVEHQYESTFGRPMGQDQLHRYKMYQKVHELADVATDSKRWMVGDDFLVARDTPPELRPWVIQAAAEKVATKPLERLFRDRPPIQGYVGRASLPFHQSVVKIQEAALKVRGMGLEPEQAEFLAHIRQVRETGDPVVPGSPWNPVNWPAHAGGMLPDLALSHGLGTAATAGFKALGASAKAAGFLGSVVGAGTVFAPGQFHATRAGLTEAGVDPETAKWAPWASAVLTTLLFSKLPKAAGFGAEGRLPETIAGILGTWAKRTGGATKLMVKQGAAEGLIQEIARATGGQSKGVVEAAENIVRSAWKGLESIGPMGLITAGGMASQAAGQPPGFSKGFRRADKAFQKAPEAFDILQGALAELPLDASRQVFEEAGGPKGCKPIERFAMIRAAKEAMEAQLNQIISTLPERTDKPTEAQPATPPVEGGEEAVTPEEAAKVSPAAAPETDTFDQWLANLSSEHLAQYEALSPDRKEIVRRKVMAAAGQYKDILDLVGEKVSTPDAQSAAPAAQPTTPDAKPAKPTHPMDEVLQGLTPEDFDAIEKATDRRKRQRLEAIQGTGRSVAEYPEETQKFIVETIQKIKEQPDATLNKPSAGTPDGGRGAQPQVPKEGGDTSGSSGGVQQSRRGDRDTGGASAVQTTGPEAQGKEAAKGVTPEAAPATQPSPASPVRQRVAKQRVTDAIAQVEALQDAKIDVDEATGIATLTLPNGKVGHIHFDADEEMKPLREKTGKPFRGLYVYETGKKGRFKEGHIYLHSDADAKTINHEVAHWLEDIGVVTRAEVLRYGGSKKLAEAREGFANAYSAWATGGRPEHGVFGRVWEFMKRLVGEKGASARATFEDVGKRTAAPEPNAEPAAAPSPVEEGLPEGFWDHEPFAKSVAAKAWPNAVDTAVRDNIADEALAKALRTWDPNEGPLKNWITMLVHQAARQEAGRAGKRNKETGGTGEEDRTADKGPTPDQIAIEKDELERHRNELGNYTNEQIADLGALEEAQRKGKGALKKMAKDRGLSDDGSPEAVADRVLQHIQRNGQEHPDATTLWQYAKRLLPNFWFTHEQLAAMEDRLSAALSKNEAQAMAKAAGVKVSPGNSVKTIVHHVWMAADRALQNLERTRFGGDATSDRVDRQEQVDLVNRRRAVAGLPPVGEKPPAPSAGKGREGGPNAPIVVSPTGPGNAPSTQEIAKQLKSDFGVPIRTGHFRAPKVLVEIYKWLERVVRVRGFNEVGAMIHGVAHDLDRAPAPGAKTGSITAIVPVAIHPELEALDYTQTGNLREGFAGFLVKFMANESWQAAPKLHDWFINHWMPSNPQKARAVLRSTEMVQRWIKAGSLGRVVAQMDFGTPRWKKALGALKTPKSTYKAIRNWIAVMWFGKFDPLLLMMKEMTGERTEAGVMEKAPAHLNPWAFAEISHMTAAARVVGMAKSGMANVTGSKTGPSLIERLAPIAQELRIPERLQEFSAFCYALHARDSAAKTVPLSKREQKVLGKKSITTEYKEPGILDADAANVIEMFKDRPGWSNAAAALTSWHRGIMEYLVDAGGATKELADVLERIYPHYMSLTRSMEGYNEAPTRGAGGGKLGNLPEPIMRRKGSGLRVIPVLETVLTSAERMIGLADKIRVFRMLVNASEHYKTLGKTVGKVDPVTTAHSASIKDLESQLKKAGADLSQANMDALLTIFSQSFIGDPKDNIGTFWRNGKRESWYVRPDLFRCLMAYDKPAKLPPLVDATLGAANRFYRAGATAWKPGFAWYTNLLRDPQTLFLQSEAQQGLARNPYTIVRNEIMGIVNDLTGGEAAELWKRGGGEAAMLLGADRRYTQEFIQELIAQTPGAKALNWVRHPLDNWRWLMSIPEAGPRIGEFTATIRKLGWKEGQPLTFEQYMKGQFAAAFGTINFRHGGELSMWLNQIFPFFNANMQGPSRMLTALKNHPVDVLTNGFIYMTLPTLALHWWNQDKDWYKNMTQEEKDRYWHIELPWWILRVPKPFEWGYLFSTLPLTILEASQGKQGVLSDAAKSAITSFTPSVVSGPAGAIVENLANWSFYQNRRLVADEEKVNPEDQYLPHTTELAKWFGRLPTNLDEDWGVSPVKVENLMSGVTGGLLTEVVKFGETMTGLSGKKTMRQLTGGASALPFFGRAFLSPTHSRVPDDFYTELVRLRQKHGSAKLREAGSAAPQRLRQFEAAAEKMSDIRFERDKVLADKSLTNAQKRDKLLDGWNRYVAAAQKAMEGKTFVKPAKPTTNQAKRDLQRLMNARQP